MPSTRLVLVTVGALAAALACRDRDADRADPFAAAPPPALQRPENADAQTGGKPGEPKALPTDVKDVTGRVARASAKEIVISPDGGDAPLTLRIGDDAAVTVDGRTSSAGNIREGARVEAAYASDAGENRAVRLRVESGAGAGKR